MSDAPADGGAVAAGALHVEVVRAWPRRHEAVRVVLAEGATVADALRDSGIALDGVAGYAVFGELATTATPLRDGDRVEVLEALRMDPKEARRRRARR
jgi:putative ubiquitin-RnfH superfamily antitoxin RatB of RatAB toxin-antitoxin module